MMHGQRNIKLPYSVGPVVSLSVCCFVNYQPVAQLYVSKRCISTSCNNILIYTAQLILTLTDIQSFVNYTFRLK
jgi:hypothetical protein